MDIRKLFCILGLCLSIILVGCSASSSVLESSNDETNQSIVEDDEEGDDDNNDDTGYDAFDFPFSFSVSLSDGSLLNTDEVELISYDYSELFFYTTDLELSGSDFSGYLSAVDDEGVYGFVISLSQNGKTYVWTLDETITTVNTPEFGDIVLNELGTANLQINIGQMPGLSSANISEDTYFIAEDQSVLFSAVKYLNQDFEIDIAYDIASPNAVVDFKIALPEGTQDFSIYDPAVLDVTGNTHIYEDVTFTDLDISGSSVTVAGVTANKESVIAASVSRGQSRLPKATMKEMSVLKPIE